MTIVLLAVAALATMMVVSQLTRPKGAPRTMRDRFIGSLTPAMIGAGLGFAYARYSMTPEALESSSMPGMYAGMGAVIAILGLRVFSLLRLMFSEFFGKRED